MASIIDSFRETFGDNLSFVKFIVLAIPVYFCYSLFLTSKNDFSGFNFLLWTTIFFLFGFLIKTTNNVLNDKDTVLPPLNPFKLALASIKGIIAIGPLTLIVLSLANYVASLINIISWLDITLKTILWLTAAAISLTAFLLFVKDEKILDAYKLKVVFDKSGDLIIAIIVFLIQLLVANFIPVGFLAYTLIILFGIGPVLYFFLAYAIVFNVGVTGHYMAQLQYEVMGL